MKSSTIIGITTLFCVLALSSFAIKHSKESTETKAEQVEYYVATKSEIDRQTAKSAALSKPKFKEMPDYSTPRRSLSLLDRLPVNMNDMRDLIRAVEARNEIESMKLDIQILKFQSQLK